MATFYSSLYALNQGLTTYAYTGPYGGKSGETVTVIGTATITGALATSDIMNLFPIPAGAHLTRFAHFYTDHGTTCTATVQTDTADILAGIALGTAVTQANSTEFTAAELGAGNVGNASAEKTVNILYTSVSTPTAGAVYTFVATYAMP